MRKSVMYFFFFKAEDGIRGIAWLDFRRVLFRSSLCSFYVKIDINSNKNFDFCFNPFVNMKTKTKNKKKQKKRPT